ncbi:MAG TPA: tetratricopeptide repeat protein [Polyangiaceae bacterium]|nr:tetratricopeptide repeat protein [Polyangiaceae bacterium]
MSPSATRLSLALRMSAFILVALSPSSALAQAPPNEARADTLFNAAKQLRDGGQVADACPMFAESKRLSPAVGVTLHLADCYERLGRTASAWEQFRDAERLAHDQGDEKRAAVARGRAQALESKLDRLTVVSQAGPHEGWQVLVDGAPLPADRWNAALAVDPGDHAITVQVPGQPSRSLSAHVDASNAAAMVRIDDAAVASPPPPATTAGPPSAATPAPAASESSAGEPASEAVVHSGTSSGRLWGGLALVGVGAVGVGFGTFFAVRKSELTNGGCSNDAQLADQAQTGATVAFAVGGVALVSALVVFVSAPSSKNQVGWVLAPVPLSGGGGATVRASF